MALREIAKHNGELAFSIIEKEGLIVLIEHLNYFNYQIRRETCACLAQIVKHKADIAEKVCAKDNLSKLLNCLKDTDLFTKKNAIICFEQIAKHSHDLASNIIKNQCLLPIYNFINESSGEARLRGILTLSNIAMHDSTLAKSLIEEKALPVIKNAAIKDTNNFVKSACAQCIFEFAKHGSDFANPLLDEGFHTVLMKQLESNQKDVQNKTENALRKLIDITQNIDFLQELFLKGLTALFQPILSQISKIIPTNPAAKK